MADTQATPDTPSGDYTAMSGFWSQVQDILDGAAAMRAAGNVAATGSNQNPYLPRFPNETQADYYYRVTNAKFSNIYADVVASLASKPFAEEVQLADGAGARFKALAEDIDGRGNNLNVFAAQAFAAGVNYAIDWILVDFTRARPRPDGRRLSIADEARQGLRPYWVHVPAANVLAVYSDVVQGQEIITHARISESVVMRAGFSEVAVERIRVFDRAPVFELVEGVTTDRVVGYAPATFKVYEARSVQGKSGTDWIVVDEGPITIGTIPMVPFITGERKGASWQFRGPMQAAADLQIEHFQQETALKSIKELTAFPMLAGNGVAAPLDAAGSPAQVPVGPKSVLFAPPYGDTGSHGEWAFIEPSAESLRFLADQVKATEDQIRELGRQPLTATAGITVVAAAYANQKASSAVQAWAYALKDALEQAFVLTALWLNIPADQAPEVRVFTDFALDAGEDKGPDVLTQARAAGDLSQRTYWDELKRRNILSADFDADEEEQQLQDELPAPDAPADVAAAMTPDPAAQAA